MNEKKINNLYFSKINTLYLKEKGQGGKSGPRARALEPVLANHGQTNWWVVQIYPMAGLVIVHISRPVLSPLITLDTDHQKSLFWNQAPCTCSRVKPLQASATCVANRKPAGIQLRNLWLFPVSSNTTDGSALTPYYVSTRIPNTINNEKQFKNKTKK